jgi:hypothetical protein
MWKQELKNQDAGNPGPYCRNQAQQDWLLWSRKMKCKTQGQRLADGEPGRRLRLADSHHCGLIVR